MTQLLIIDNGSRKAGSVLNLRRIANKLSVSIGQHVSPVSLQHADKISPDRLDGLPANTLEPFIREQLESGERNFILIPLFFGESRALTSFVPTTMKALAESHGTFTWSMADVLSPESDGDPELAAILVENIEHQLNQSTEHVVLVDHGSPIPEVTHVRKSLAKCLDGFLEDRVSLHQAVMERREGPEYDFNGPLLSEALSGIAQNAPNTEIIISMLFLSPGRHAGAGGDIEEICAQVLNEFPNLSIKITALVGENDRILDLLKARYLSCGENESSR